MPTMSRVVAPTPKEREVVSCEGERLMVPSGWALQPPGDGPLTRRIKAKGVSWTVEVRRGRKRFSQGIWAPVGHIEAAKAELQSKRSAPGYQQKKQQDQLRRDRKQKEYVAQFAQEVLVFLDFHPRHGAMAEQFALLVSQHATPVGSGTVARTTRIPVEERARRAVIAWMRHRVTAYDRMRIARIKGERRRVRRELAEQSIALLRPYRQGAEVTSDCPLRRAVLHPHNDKTPS